MKYRKTAVKELSEQTGIKIAKKANVEELGDIIFVNGVPSFFRFESLLLPTLHTLKKFSTLPFVTVDEGAVKFLIKGADMMRPGIVKFDPFSANDSVAIKALDTEIPIGVGLALMSSSEAEETSTGRIVRTLHYAGDNIWNATLR